MNEEACFIVSLAEERSDLKITARSFVFKVRNELKTAKIDLAYVFILETTLPATNKIKTSSIVPMKILDS